MQIFHEISCFVCAVLRPISATSRLMLNRNSSVNMPRVLADLVMQDIEVLLSRQQVGDRDIVSS